jgi:hypothetical protein
MGAVLTTRGRLPEHSEAAAWTRQHDLTAFARLVAAMWWYRPFSVRDSRELTRVAMGALDALEPELASKVLLSAAATSLDHGAMEECIGIVDAAMAMLPPEEITFGC